MDLYALPPEEFTAARDAEVRAARKAGEREQAKALAALRRPTVSAHVVNALARAEPALLEQLLELGRQLAQAQAGGQGEALRSLGEQRRALVEAVADRAAAAADRALPPAVRAEVVATLEAALGDPASGAAVRTGRLVRPLSYAGFGGVDLEGAVAEAAGGPAPALPAEEGHEGASEAEVTVRPARARAGGRKATGTADAVAGGTAEKQASGRQAREQRAREQEAREQETGEQQAREQEARDQQAREQQAREQEALARRRQAATAAALTATEVLDDAVRAAERAEAERTSRAAGTAQAARAEREAAGVERQAAEAEREARQALEQAQERLERAREQHRQAEHAERQAEKALARLHAQVSKAQGAAERARAALSELT